ncbi:MAG: pilus assembly protein [Pseudomonadota bacterium]
MGTKILSHWRRFLDDTRGSTSVEFIICMPMLFWAFMAMYTFFDGYRQSAINLKAAYTVGDILSRETQAIDDDFIDSMHDLYQFLTTSGSSTALRVTVIRWDEDDDRYYLDWSEARGGYQALQNSDVLLLEDDLPVMPDQERVILVETSNSWTPLFAGTGLSVTDLDNFVFTSPRFAPQLAFSND